MRNLVTIFMIIVISGCQPAFSKSLNNLGNSKQCAEMAYKYSLLVRYKDANISPIDVIENIAPRLNLPLGWQKTLPSLLDVIYKDNLTDQQVFDRMYVPCIYGYGG